MAITFTDKQEALEYAQSKKADGYLTSISRSDGHYKVSVIGKASTPAAFGSPGGKRYSAPKIVSKIPPHKTYVEPFAGGASVYFRHEPSQTEVLNDKDKQIAFAFRFLRDLTPEQFSRLKRYNWTPSESKYEQVKRLQPKDDVEQFYKFYYIKKNSWAGTGTTYSKSHEPYTPDTNIIWKAHERIKNAHIHGEDAIQIIKKYDKPDTFFYLDPPYPGTDNTSFGAGQNYSRQDLARLIDKLKYIKGKFALSINKENKDLIPSSWKVSTITTPNLQGETYQGEKRPTRKEILVTNY